MASADTKKGTLMEIDFGELTTSDVSALIDLWVFSEKNRHILKRSWLDDVSLERIAEEVDLTTRATFARYQKAKAQFFKHVTILH